MQKAKKKKNNKKKYQSKETKNDHNHTQIWHRFSKYQTQNLG